jgi:DNA adenine methylase
MSFQSPVNVSKVKQLSPFRYPGGKTWFVPEMQRRLCGRAKRPNHFIEPFAGGGSISLMVADEGLAGAVIMCERDEDVAVVWECCLCPKKAVDLAERILNFPLSVESAEEIRNKTPVTPVDHAFRTIVFNRVSRGGITAKGAGQLKRGEKDKGITSRWYPQTLADRIFRISQLTDRISFIHGDAFDVIAEHRDNPTAVFFVDPPYTAGSGKRAGSRLYRYCELDHDRLFAEMAKVSGDFVMTYDKCDEVAQMACSHGFIVSEVPMRNAHHETVYELVITKNAPDVIDPLLAAE